MIINLRLLSSEEIAAMRSDQDRLSLSLAYATYISLFFFLSTAAVAYLGLIPKIGQVDTTAISVILLVISASFLMILTLYRAEFMAKEKRLYDKIITEINKERDNMASNVRYPISSFLEKRFPDLDEEKRGKIIRKLEEEEEIFRDSFGEVVFSKSKVNQDKRDYHPHF